MLRRIASRLHLWLGIAAGLFLVVVGLTGSVLVFEDTIDAALNPELLRAEPQGERASLSALAHAVQEAFPDREIRRIEFAGNPEETTRVTLRGTDRTVFVDPYTGTVLGSRRPMDSVTGIIFELHTKLFAGHSGETAVGLLGALLMILSLTGLVLWWRGRRHVRRGLTVKWRDTPQRVNYDLHNALGIYAAIPLLIVAFTGTGLVFYSTFTDAVHGLTGTPQPPAPPQSTCCPAEPPPSLDSILEQARAAFPSAVPARIDLPTDERGAHRVRLRLPEEIHPVGMTMVYLDQYSGEVLHAESAVQAPFAQRFNDWFYPLHIGSFGGLAVRLIYVFIGLSPAILAVTGAVIWYLRRRKRSSEPPAPVRRTRPVAAPLPRELGSRQ